MLMDKVCLRVSILHLPRILPLALPKCWLMDDRSDPPTPQLNQSIQEQEELEERARRAQEAAAASDGWTLVTSRKVGIPRSENSFSARGNAPRTRETAQVLTATHASRTALIGRISFWVCITSLPSIVPGAGQEQGCAWHQRVCDCAGRSGEQEEDGCVAKEFLPLPAEGGPKER